MPHVVTSPTKEVKFIVINRDENFPGAMTLMALQAPYKSIIRFAGGCKGMKPEDKPQMLEFFRVACAGFRGVAMSGATSSLNSLNEVDPMITDIPDYLARTNPEIISLGTAPRTACMAFKENMQLHLDDWGTRPNGGMRCIVLIQDGGENKLEWNGDLPAYFSFMNSLQKYSGFHPALVVWNGGPVTIEEALLAKDKGWPVFVVTGTGRAADNELGPDHFTGTNVYHVDKAHPELLNNLLIANEVISL